MHEQPFTLQDAENAKNKNIIELALGFSATTRMFAKQYDDLMWRRIQRRVR